MDNSNSFNDLVYWVRLISAIVCFISLIVGSTCGFLVISNKSKALSFEKDSEKLKDAVSILEQWKKRQ